MEILQNVVPESSYIEFLKWLLLSHGKILAIQSFLIFFLDQSPLVGNSLHISKYIKTEVCDIFTDYVFVHLYVCTCTYTSTYRKFANRNCFTIHEA